jgi:hypothetical protein
MAVVEVDAVGFSIKFINCCSTIANRFNAINFWRMNAMKGRCTIEEGFNWAKEWFYTSSNVEVNEARTSAFLST